MSIVGTVIALLANVFFYPENRVAVVAQCIALLVNLLAFFIRTKYPAISVVTLTSMILAITCYASFKPTHSVTTSLTVILLCGFIHSVMLRKGMLWFMHVVCGVCIVLVFTSLVISPNQPFALQPNKAIPAAVTYTILYIMLTFTTAVLKASYDRIHTELSALNNELYRKTNEIEVQNEELIQTQERLSMMNKNLEDIVNERTAKIQGQNRILMRYAYTNAHHLRGPVARLLGLAMIYKLEAMPDPEFYMERMVQEANEIDSVVKKINTDLELEDPMFS